MLLSNVREVPETHSLVFGYFCCACNDWVLCS